MQYLLGFEASSGVYLHHYFKFSGGLKEQLEKSSNNLELQFFLENREYPGINYPMYETEYNIHVLVSCCFAMN